MLHGWRVDKKSGCRSTGAGCRIEIDARFAGQQLTASYISLLCEKLCRLAPRLKRGHPGAYGYCRIEAFKINYY